MKKPVFEKGNADWLSELPSGIKNYNNSHHHSIKMTPFETSEKTREKVVLNNIKDTTETQELKCNPGDVVRTSDIKKVLSKGDSTIYICQL